MFDLERLLDGLPEKETVIFFAAFSRFEYAIMHCGYLRGGVRAEPDWRRLTQDLGSRFFALASGFAPTLVGDPPKTLLNQGGIAMFGPPPNPATNTAQLVGYARQVRNNLFHGNKAFGADRLRDARLMRESLRVLECILRKKPEIRAAFDEPQAF